MEKACFPRPANVLRTIFKRASLDARQLAVAPYINGGKLLLHGFDAFYSEQGDYFFTAGKQPDALDWYVVPAQTRYAYMLRRIPDMSSPVVTSFARDDDPETEAGYIRFENKVISTDYQAWDKMILSARKDDGSYLSREFKNAIGQKYHELQDKIMSGKIILTQLPQNFSVERAFIFPGTNILVVQSRDLNSRSPFFDSRVFLGVSSNMKEMECHVQVSGPGSYFLTREGTLFIPHGNSGFEPNWNGKLLQPLSLSTLTSFMDFTPRMQGLNHLDLA